MIMIQLLFMFVITNQNHGVSCFHNQHHHHHVVKGRQHQNDATMKREISVMNTVTSYQSNHIKNNNKNYNKNYNDEMNNNVILSPPIFSYSDHASSMIARQKLVTVPTLFASEIHRSSLLKRRKLLQSESSTTRMTSLTTTLPSITTQGKYDNIIVNSNKAADEEAVIGVVFPLYGDIIKMFHSIQTFISFLSSSGINNDNNNNNTTNVQKQQQQRYLLGRRNPRIKWWSDHPIFQRLCAWAFEVCATCTSTTYCTISSDGIKRCKKVKKEVCLQTARIDRTQVYAGILLVHLQLAPYLGVAACHPPSREMIDEMFYKTDYNDLGTIGLEEFTDILILSFTHISSRIIMYYCILLVGLPIAAKHAYEFFTPIRHIFFTSFITTSTSNQNNVLQLLLKNLHYIKGFISIIGTLVERIVCLTIFVCIVPFIFHYIDQITVSKLLKPKQLKIREKKRQKKIRNWNHIIWNNNNNDYYDDAIHSFDDIS